MPRKEGTSAVPRFATYSRSMIVLMMDANVDGRPMPISSSALINDASV